MGSSILPQIQQDNMAFLVLECTCIINVTKQVKITLYPKSARGQGGLWVGGAFAFVVALAAQRATTVGHPKP